MARGLAIETSGGLGSVAVTEAGHVLAEDQFPQGLKHAAAMVPRIDALLHRLSWRPGDIEELYVSVGPGSFTGLRIGVTFAKSFSFATGARLVAVSSVRVLAENSPADATNVVIVLDAKRDQIFTARYERSGDLWIEREPAHLDDLPSVLARSSQPLWLLGEGIPYHRQFVPASDDVHLAPEELWPARAAVVARLGAAMAAEGRFIEPDRLVPIYIRRPEAEEKMEKLLAATNPSFHK